ncbi:MAG: hypothetical protein F6J89_14060 [Symploca sp. SIO1C4]|uniref:KGK domain-containing protein n=1 Tax=Symploca sp. SIO1C4 TaxID=2607765 RepID=A0A6B3NAW1_9CYAN|nr:hypothetical protein [Symploca sp. SIO1C4]
MSNQFEPLATGEVLSIEESTAILIGHQTFRVDELVQAIKKQLQRSNGGWNKEKNAWFSQEGINCEVLRFNSQGWQKGKVRISVEFCPQEWDDEVSPTTEIESSQEIESSEDLDLGEPLLDDDEQLDLGMAAAIDTGDFSNEYQSLEASDETFAGLDSEASTGFGEEIELEQTPDNFDEEFDLTAMEDGIEQNLELLDEPITNEEDLVDLSELSSGDEDDLDLGEDILAVDDDDLDLDNISLGNDEFGFGDVSSDQESQQLETDPLLNDVWQDLSDANEQKKQW